jgi:hypothetical protein
MMDWGRIGRVLSSRRAIETEVHDELSFHIEGRIRELVAEGWSEGEARKHVLERFGDVEAFAAACRSYDTQRAEREGWKMKMDGWLRDGRMALRTMQRQKGFTSVVVFTLALGIGATTAVFSVVEGVLLRPLPFPAPDRLAVVWQNDRATGTVRENASVADYYDYVERSETFGVLAMHGQGTAVLSRADSDPLQLNSAVVSQSLADVLGISMQVGRSFRPEEDVPDGPDVAILSDRLWRDAFPDVAILSDRLWRDAFGADPSVVGRTITIGEVGVEVVGVLPSHVEYPAATTDIWMPIQQDRLAASRQSHWVRVVGRLAPERSLEAAQAEMVAIMADLEMEYPEAGHRLRERRQSPAGARRRAES